MKYLDFHRYPLFALTGDESRSSSDFRLENDLITSVWYDVELSIEEGCHELQVGSNPSWNEPVHSVNQYPTGDHPGMFWKYM